MKICDVIKESNINLGDSFDIELGNVIIETGVIGFMPDGVIVESDAKTLVLLGISGALFENIDRFEDVSEAKYQGRNVPLGKPMQGDVKKSKVYVRGPKGNVVKVNFGDKNMKIKKSNPKRRKSFRARHNCDNPGPRWKARYWSCRAW